MSTCLICNKPTKRSFYKYCSNKCQSTDRYNKYIEQWKLGLVDGNRGKVTHNISGHLKRYLIEKFGERCWLCGWDEKHKITGHVPLEIDHINGNFQDNNENNLRVLCPNCHSLSVSYKNLNKRHGRHWRMAKYIKS